MTQFVALSRQRHAGMRWRRYDSYAFAADVSLAPLAAEETALAAADLPLAFAERAGRWGAFAVLGLLPGQNLHVGKDGRWRGDYVPAALRAYPFAFLPAKGRDGGVLAIDADAELVGADEPGTELLLDAEGRPSPALAKVMRFMQARERGFERVRVQAAALREHGVLVPWPIQVRFAEGERKVEGLWMVDDAALARLGDAEFLALRASGALTLAYSHIVSKRHLSRFGRLLVEHAAAAAPAQAPGGGEAGTEAGGELDLEFLAKGGTLDLSGLH
jgi:hypothetical protein